MSDINKQFRHDRIELGLTQLDAAVLLGVSRVTYIKWETEPETMPIGKYEQLTREFTRLRELKEQEV
jgi:DNA-binding XRE family transcriptional regulator